MEENAPIRRSSNRTKFVPNVNAAASRPAKVDPSVVVDKKSSIPPSDTRTERGGTVQGHCRGVVSPKGPSTLLARTFAATAAVSGPFAQGPANSIRHVRDNVVSFVGAGGDRGTKATGDSPSSGPSVNLTRLSRRMPIAGDVNIADPSTSLPSLDELILSSVPGQHPPVSLCHHHKKEKLKRDQSKSTISTEAHGQLDDDMFIDREEILAHGRLHLFQLPACMPFPLAEPLSSNNSVAMRNTDSLLELEKGEGCMKEQAMDIEAFKAIQEANDNSDNGKSYSWPVSAEGFYGKLRVHASGRISLLVNGATCRVLPSSSSSFHSGSSSQRVVAIDSDYQQSFDLGSISSQFVFVPTLNYLLSQPLE